MGYKQLKTLPNIEGYEFIAILEDGSKIKTKVKKRDNGLHYFDEYSITTKWEKIK